MAEKAANILRAKLGEDNLSLAFTTQPKHASELALNAQGFSSIITLGGDGAVHEVANGLMWRDRETRPTLGIIPAGSGNDYAKSLKIPIDIEKAASEVVTYRPRPVDVGKVNEDYFVETLSFGLDAAIAIDTMDRRKKTGRKGALLYMESGFNQLLHHLDSFPYKVVFDDDPPVESSSITFAIQIGPYYGGGFKICPDAKVDDGVFEICIGHGPLGVMKAATIFLRAKGGNHTGYKEIELLSAKKIHIEFEEEPPAQMDGEIITGTVFDVSMIPDALQVLRP